MAAFFLAMGRCWGRRRLLILTIIGYTLATLVTAFAPTIFLLTLTQFLSRTFGAAENAVATTMVVEEFSAGERAGRSGFWRRWERWPRSWLACSGSRDSGTRSFGWQRLLPRRDHPPAAGADRPTRVA